MSTPSASLPLPEWVSALSDLSEGISLFQKGMTQLCDLCLLAGPSAATESYRRQLSSSSRAFMQALEGAGAMAEGLQSLPEEARDPMQMSRTLMGLIYGQGKAYFSEMNTASCTASAAFSAEKAAAFGAVTPTQSRKSVSASELVVDDAAAADVESSAVGEKKEKKEKKDKKDKKKKKGEEAAADDEADGDASGLVEIATPTSQDASKANKSSSLLPLEVSSQSISPSVPTPSERLPFIKVRNTLNDSLGVAIIATRPDGFLPFEQIVTDSDVKAQRCALRYYMQCPSLSALLTTTLNSNHTDAALADKQQEATLDLLCDALVSEDINVLPFMNASGEVTLDATKPLPNCAWRSADGSDATMDTFFAFIDHQVNGLGQCLIFHDVLMRSDEEKEQIVHVIKVVGAGIVEVSAYVPDPSLLGGAVSAGALASLYRRYFTAFFPESNYNPNAQKASSSLNSMGDTMQMRKASADAAHVAAQREAAEQEASAKAGGKKGSGGIVGITKAIASAPLTVVTSTVSAINDATQAATFKRNFPELKDEEVIVAYNCAWSENSKVLRQGYLYATTMHFCFQSTVLSGKFILAYDEIEGMKKAKNAMFDNSIEIEDFRGEKYFLTSFVSRDEAYKTLFKAWTGQR